MESISQDSYNMANALMRLRIFFTSCNLSINTQFGSPSIVVTHLPWQKVSLLNPNDLENLFQYLTDRKFNLGLGLSEKDFFKNEQVKTLVSNSLILKELYNSAQITNIGLSSITDRVYYNYSSIPSFPPSLPIPESFIPPKGIEEEVGFTSLTPIIAKLSCSIDFIDSEKLFV